QTIAMRSFRWRPPRTNADDRIGRRRIGAPEQDVVSRRGCLDERSPSQWARDPSSPDAAPLQRSGMPMHLGLAEADQTFLRWVLRGERSCLIRRHRPSRTPWRKPTGILSPALDSATRGLLTGLGYKSLVGVAPVQDLAFCREARPCQRRELPSEGKGTTAAPPAVTSRCSCIGCRRRTTIR